jgi:SAM-dependent methyltransferase
MMMMSSPAGGADSRERSGSRESTIASRETGLATGLILGRTLLGIEHLHYGYWTKDLEVTIRNLPRAQESYTRSLISLIPRDVETVLDVGCGPATTALRLVEAGYEVECVQPPGALANLAREALGGRARLHECSFQEFETDRRYDLVLFSESLLFIRPLSMALSRSADLLSDGGYLLVSDIFRKSSERRSSTRARYHTGPIGGGHYLGDFEKAMAEQPFCLLENVDISHRIAPTFDLIAGAVEDLKPAYELLMGKLLARRPWTTRLLRRVLRLKKYEEKHLARRRERTGKSFLETKTYRRFLYQLDPEANSGVRGQA